MSYYLVYIKNINIKLFACMLCCVFLYFFNRLFMFLEMFLLVLLGLAVFLLTYLLLISVRLLVLFSVVCFQHLIPYVLFWHLPLLSCVSLFLF